MRERRSSKYNNTYRTFIRFLFSIFCLAGAAAGLFLFWTDLTRSQIRSSDQSVGTLVYKHLTVQRRFSDRLAWNLLPLESPVYNGDLIRTADLSDARITFISEDSIDLAENSLIVIRFNVDTGEPKVELMGGKLSLSSVSGKAAILAGGKELKPVQGSDLKVQGGSDQAEFQVIKGQVLVSDQSDRSSTDRTSADRSSEAPAYSMEAGQTASTGSEGVVKISDSLIVLRPFPNQEFDLRDGDITFVWANNSHSADRYVRLEIAPDRRFREITDSVNSYNPDITSADISLSPGFWYWRVYEAARAGAEPLSVLREGRITVLEPPPPQPEQRITLAPVEELETLSPEPALIIPVQAAPPVETVPVVTAAPEPPPPAPAPIPVPAPVPAITLLPRPGGLVPALGTVIDGEFLKNNRSIIFSWNPVAQADAYLFTLRQTSIFMQQVFEPRLEFDRLGTLINGQCVWRVEAVTMSADGSIARRGQVAEGRFTVAVPRPAAPQVDKPGILYEN